MVAINMEEKDIIINELVQLIYNYKDYFQPWDIKRDSNSTQELKDYFYHRIIIDGKKYLNY